MIVTTANCVQWTVKIARTKTITDLMVETIVTIVNGKSKYGDVVGERSMAKKAD